MLLYYLSLATTDEERDIIERIYLDYYPVMKYEAMKYLKNPYDVEDIVHETMLAVIDNISCVDINNEFTTRGFCKVIAKNKAIDFLRKKDNQTVQTEDYFQPADTEDPEDIVVSEDNYKRLLETINSLNDTYREVCYLKYVNGLKEWQIAEALNLHPKTVSLRIFRGKQILRKILRKEFSND